MKLILASASPRRQQMLRDLGVGFEIESPDIDESQIAGETVETYVKRLASQKAESVAQRLGLLRNRKQDWAVLAADTSVCLPAGAKTDSGPGVILGKPADAEDALRMLGSLSGQTHAVVSGYCWLGALDGRLCRSTEAVRTKVTFANRAPEFWVWYVSTGEPMDKAGAYAAQGIGMSFIDKVSGSYSNVVGLPLSHVLASFAKAFGKDLRECCRATD